MSTRELIERAVEFAASDIADHHEYSINERSLVMVNWAITAYF